MCAWERFCAFAREPERRLVGVDCHLTVAGVSYEVDAELAGETVVVWWGLFDQELWVEHGEERMGRSGRLVARSRCIVTASTANRARKSGPTGWLPLPARSRCRARPCRARMAW